MKIFNRALVVLLPVFLASLAASQVQPGMFSNIIIIVQENRTPDNLLGLHAPPTTGCPTRGDFPGADIVNGGTNIGHGTYTCNAAYPMNSGQSPPHQQSDWLFDWDGGKMDGFCDNAYSAPCFPYSYVVNSPNTTDTEPYFSIAFNYGFANYMFQTNQGPSYAAHQFLFTGTSAPVAVNTSNDYFKYFVVNNPSNTNGTGGQSGCPQLVDLDWIDPKRRVAAGLGGNYECYPHDSVVTSATCQNNGALCDKSTSLFSTWRYYAPEPGSIWDAPEAIPEVCYGVNDLSNAGRSCGAGTNTFNHGNWQQHMTFYSTENFAPIFSDIQTCNLANISWVIPDSAWSDHPKRQYRRGPRPFLGWEYRQCYWQQLHEQQQPMRLLG